MKQIDKPFVCPCCGYAGLKFPAYQNLGFPPWPDLGNPPYSKRYGEPSYDVCDCCGFEFGTDDEGISQSHSFQTYLTDWIASGCVWFDKESKPLNWSLEKQLVAAQISIAQPPNVSSEIFDIVNEHDEVIGKKLRREVHRDGDRHRAVHVLVFNSRGEVFLQKRSMSKDTFPGAWDSSASGHLDCGEDYDACAIRELREEIGLQVSQRPRRLFKIEACLETGQEFVWVYRCEHEGPFTLHPEEIERGEWFAPESVTKWIAEKPEEFARAFILIWKKVTAAI